ncbi:hypothetical protein CLE01_07280 [Cryobacterium levicorallinum]|uniref:Luciferase-like monooxygenase n=1 Tax=Cryobacterium levicorallinum TaxID=995038 RepID=A0ABY1E901_9MICO|nr:hypothetical protein CLE01_07280 [Cryobacterium levicorallinum]SFH15776.1 Luciferase-like monooxygenase [Cryobacterium levicorallinum]
MHEAWSLISAFAATTTRVHLGQMCTCMSYRNPGYLAKVATTADIISGGRIEPIVALGHTNSMPLSAMPSRASWLGKIGLLRALDKVAPTSGEGRRRLPCLGDHGSSRRSA